MDNPHHSSNECYFTRRTTQPPGIPPAYDVHSNNANVPYPTDATTTTLNTVLTPIMYGGSFEGSRRSGFIQTDFLEGSHIDQSTIHGPNHFLEGSHIDPATSYGPDRFLEGSHTDGNTSHGPNYPSHNHLAQFSPTSIHSISSNPAPIGEGTWGTTHQPFLGPTLSYPHTEPYAGSATIPLQPSQASGSSELSPRPSTVTHFQVFQNDTQQQAVHTLYGLYFDRWLRKPSMYHGIGLVPQYDFYKPNGYIYQYGLGILPYFVRSEKDLQTNHALVGYLQKEGSTLDKKNRLWHHYHALDDLGVVHPETASLLSILEKQTQLGSIVVKLELSQDMGSEVHSPMSILIYQPGDPAVLEHGGSLPYHGVRDVLLAQDPTRHTASFWMPGQGDGVDDEDGDVDEKVDNEIYLPGTRCFSKSHLQKYAPKFQKLLDRTLLFFHVKLLKGEFFPSEVHEQALSPGEQGRVDSVCCHSAWAEALAYSETSEYEEGPPDVRVLNSLRSPVRIIVEDHFPHILANQKWAAESYHSAVRQQVNLLVGEIGIETYLRLFSYGTNLEHFCDPARGTTTLCNTKGTPFHHEKFLEFLRRLFHGPVPPTLTTWPRRDQSVGAVFFNDEITAEVVAVCAAHWLLAGIRHKGGFDHSSMPRDIRKLVEVMHFRLSRIHRNHLESLQAIVKKAV